MEWREFVIELAKACAWPATLIYVLGLRFHKPTANLLGRIRKGKAFGVELFTVPASAPVDVADLKDKARAGRLPPAQVVKMIEAMVGLHERRILAALIAENIPLPLDVYNLRHWQAAKQMVVAKGLVAINGAKYRLLPAGYDLIKLWIENIPAPTV